MTHANGARSVRTKARGLVHDHAPLAQALALVPHGVVLVGRRRKVLYANAKAIACLEAAHGIRIEAGRLCKGDTARAARLERALARARRLAPSAIAGAWLVPRATGRGRPLTLVVTAQRLATARRCNAVAAIHLVDPESNHGVPAAWLQQLYRLTRREADLTSLLTRGRELHAAAAELRISIGTARNHLKRIFLKTSTQSQVHLVRLLMATASALHCEIGG